MFDRIAPTYDLLNNCISLGMHRHWKALACKSLSVKAGAHVLDVCTGTGDLISLLRSEVGHMGQITGLDFSGNMLALARQRTPETDQLRFIQGDAMALPFDDQTFDGALVSFGLRNVASVPQVLAQMARVVKPGGWVVNLDTCPNPNLPGYRWYFNTVMPWLGQRLSNNPTAYTYLAKSTEGFYTPTQLVEMFQTAGLQNVSATGLAFGAVSFQAGQVVNANPLVDRTPY